MCVCACVWLWFSFAFHLFHARVQFSHSNSFWVTAFFTVYCLQRAFSLMDTAKKEKICILYFNRPSHEGHITSCRPTLSSLSLSLSAWQIFCQASGKEKQRNLHWGRLVGYISFVFSREIININNVDIHHVKN